MNHGDHVDHYDATYNGEIVYSSSKADKDTQKKATLLWDGYGTIPLGYIPFVLALHGMYGNNQTLLLYVLMDLVFYLHRQSNLYQNAYHKRATWFKDLQLVS